MCYSKSKFKKKLVGVLLDVASGSTPITKKKINMKPEPTKNQIKGEVRMEPHHLPKRVLAQFLDDVLEMRRLGWIKDDLSVKETEFKKGRKHGTPSYELHRTIRHTAQLMRDLPELQCLIDWAGHGFPAEDLVKAIMGMSKEQIADARAYSLMKARILKDNNNFGNRREKQVSA